MDYIKLLTIFLDYSNLIPAAILCVAPMRNQMRYSVAKTVRYAIITLFSTLIIITLINYCFDIEPNSLLFLALILCFIAYHCVLNVHISKTLAMFSYACVVMALISNYSIMFDAAIHPASGANVFSLEGSLFQTVTSFAVALLLYLPFKKYGTILIDRLDIPNVWFTVLILTTVFLAGNIIIRPLKYQTLYTNKVFLAYIIVVTTMLITLLLLTVIFYFIVTGLLKKMETDERNKMLEMQESQYIKQQDYMEKTATARHDFRQMILTLESLVVADDYAAIKEFITDYADSLPKNEVISFCPNHAVNALLNYYHETAEEFQIKTAWQVELPAKLPVANTDLCNILGNLLENALIACKDMPERDRYIDLSVATSDDETYLCIVMTNPYWDTRRKFEGMYLSTHKNGSGIGLSSVKSIANKYDGVARFSDYDGEFCSDVMLMMEEP